MHHGGSLFISSKTCSLSQEGNRQRGVIRARAEALRYQIALLLLEKGSALLAGVLHGAHKYFMILRATVRVSPSFRSFTQEFLNY